MQRAALDQDRGHRAAPAVELGLDHHALGGAVGVGAQIHHLGLQQNRLDQVVEACLFLGRDRNGLGVAAQAFDHDLVLQQLVDDLVRVRARFVDLVDRHDDRRAGRLGVIYRLDGLGHDAVIGRNDQDDDVGDVGAARAHGRKSRVAGGVQESHPFAVGQSHLIGADVLGDAAVLALGHIGGAQGVQQRGLAVVHMAHDGDHGRAGKHVLVEVLGVEEAFFHVGFRHAAHGVAEFGGHQLGGVVVDHVVDLQHQALTHQELDHVHPAGGHPLGQLAHGDDVGNDHVAGHAGLLLLAPATTLFLFPFASPANRGQGTHAFDGVLAVAGHRLDGQAAFAAFGFALGARDGGLERGALAALAAFFVQIVRPAVDLARAGGLARGAGDFGRRRRRRGTAAAGRTRSAGALASRRGARGQGRIAHGLRFAEAPFSARRSLAGRALALGPRTAVGEAAALRPGPVVAIGGGAAGVAVIAPEVAAWPIAGTLSRTGSGATGRAAGRTIGFGRPLGGPFGRARFHRRGLARLGRALGDGRDGLHGGRGRCGLAGFGFAAARGVFLGAASFGGMAFGGLLLLGFAGGFQHALAGLQLLGRQIQIGRGRRSGRTRRRRRLCRPGLHLEGRRARRGGRRNGRAFDATALGLHDHGLGPAVAEALLHRA